MSNKDAYLKPGDLELKPRRGSRAEMTEIDEFDAFDETNPLTAVAVRNVTVQRLGASRAEDDSDDEKKSLQPYSDGMDEPDSFVPNGNGVARKISSGHFPQWPTSYPSNVALEPLPNLNAYQQKKSMAQGMLDLALLSANANQLRYVLDMRDHTNYFYISIALIVISLVFQVLVAFALIFKARYNVENEAEYSNANRINNFIMVGILLITIANVLSSAFAPATTSR